MESDAGEIPQAATKAKNEKTEFKIANVGVGTIGRYIPGTHQ